jgi:Xaa-Pro dipeptidase
MMDTKRRLSDLRAFMDEQRIDLCIVMHPENQYYLSGFKAVTYSRPIVFIVEKSLTNLIIPALEKAHAAHEAKTDKTFVYYEHPEKANEGISYLHAIDKIISKYTKGTRVGVETNVVSAYLYTHLRMADFEPVDIGQKITEMRSIKDEFEIEMLIKY